MSEQSHALFKPVLSNQGFQAAPLRTLTRNRAFKLDTQLVELRTGPHQKSVIFYRMQTPDGQQHEPGAPRIRSGILPHGMFEHLHSQPCHHDLLCLYSGIVFEYVAPVILGHSQAERAILQLLVQISAMQ